MTEPSQTPRATSAPEQAGSLEQAAQLAAELVQLLLAAAQDEQGRREAEESVRVRVEQLEGELATVRAIAASLNEELVALEKVRREAETARLSAEAEAKQVQERLTDSEAQEATRGELDQRLAEKERELEAARSSASELQARVDSVQEAGQADVEQRKQALEAQKRGELALACKEAELEESGRHVTLLQEQVKTLETERAENQTELERSTKDAAGLRVRIEELERTAQSGGSRPQEAEPEDGALRQSTAEVREAALDEARGVIAAARTEDTGVSGGALVSALTALRRTPFVPPMLKAAFSSVEELYHGRPSAEEDGAPPMRVLLLDREIARLEAIARDMEKGGLRVLLAHYVEEVSFFLGTPEGARTDAVVCDVMALSPEQDVLDLFRSWRRGVPELTIVLSYQEDSTAEQTRVSQVPPGMAGRLPMPLTAEATVAAIRAALTERAAD